MPKYLYQPYRASTLARELQALSEQATPTPWEAHKAHLAGDSASITAPAMVCGHKKDKTRHGIVCETTDDAGRFTEQLNADMLLIAGLRNNVDVITTLLGRVDALETALEFYANRENHGVYYAACVGPMAADKGTKARAALFNLTEEQAAARAWPPAEEPVTS